MIIVIPFSLYFVLRHFFYLLYMFYTRTRVRGSEIDLYNGCFRRGEDPEGQDPAADAS